MYFLIDATSFYCSAEKVFAPHLRKRPTITLSNDGAIVAVCPIAKRLGIKKFVPFFQVRDLVNKHNVVVTSSNYELTVGKFFRWRMLEFFMINKLDAENKNS